MPLRDVSLCFGIHSPISTVIFLGYIRSHFPTSHFAPASTHSSRRSSFPVIHAAISGRTTLLRHPISTLIAATSTSIYVATSGRLILLRYPLTPLVVRVSWLYTMPLPDVTPRSGIYSPLSSAFFLGHRRCQLRTPHM